MPSNQSWVPPTNSVLKLHVGDKEIRRVTASAFIKDGCLVYRLLFKKIVKFSGVDVGDNSSLKQFEVKTSYSDEDGDMISFSSNAEFIDAWKSCDGLVFRVKSSVEKKNVEASKDANSENVEDVVDALPLRFGRRDGKGRGLVGIRGRLSKLETQVEHITQTLKLNLNMKNVEEYNDSCIGDALHGDIETSPLRVGRRECKGRLLFAIRGRVNTLEAQVEQIIQTMKNYPELTTAMLEIDTKRDCEGEDISEATAENLEGNESTMEEPKSGTSNQTEMPDRPKWNEVHINVQCDGCLIWPIKGARYHANNKPNYDLCEKCYLDSKTSGILFSRMNGVLCPDFEKTPSAAASNMTLKGKAACEVSKFIDAKEVKDGNDKGNVESSDKSTSSNTKRIIGIKHYGVRCDGCTMNPILGSRYRATNMADYDLCEQCHQNVEMPDVQFEKVACPLFKNTKCTMEKEFELKSGPALCFDTFEDDEDAVRDADLDVVDGSVDSNLTNKSESEETAGKIQSIAVNVTAHDESKKLGGLDALKSTTKCTDSTREDPEEKSDDAKSSVAKLVLKDEEKLSMAPDARLEVHHRFSCDGCLMRPIVGPRYSAKNGLDFDLCDKCFMAKKIPNVEFEKATGNETSSCPFSGSVNSADNTKHDPRFIHGRHTCDRCMTTPIVGFRYHALNLPDYDLCSQCYSKYEGNEVVFEVDELDRDRSRQAVWSLKMKRGKVKSFEERRKKASRIASVKKEEMAPVPRNAQKEEKKDDISQVLALTLNESAKVANGFVKEFADALKESSDAGSELSQKVEDNDLVKEFPHALEKEVSVFSSKSTEKVEDTAEKSREAVPPQFVVREKEKTIETITQEPKEDCSLPRDIRGEDSMKGLSEISSLPSLDSATKVCKVEPILRSSKVADDVEIMSSVKSEDKSSDILIAEDNNDLEDVDVNKVIDDFASTLSAPEKVTISSVENCSLSDSKRSNVDIASEGEDGDEKSQATADEWDILDDVAQQIESDAALARAASLVGSALFEDSQRESQSSYTVPRWNEELKQLHELGFFDDNSSVEVLDSLHAANIGSGVVGPIRIEKVVERLLEKKR